MTDRIQAIREAVASIEQYNLRRDVDPSDYIHLRLDHISALLKAHDEAVRRADELSTKLAEQAISEYSDTLKAMDEMKERCAQEIERVGPKDGPSKLITEGFAAAIRSLSSTTGATNKD